MNYLQALDLSKALPHKVLFERINFCLTSTEKVGLVARNGEGKSTLLKVLAGLEEPDTGEVRVHPDVTLGYLAQADTFDPKAKVYDALFAHDNEKGQLIKEYEQALAINDPSLPKLMQKIEAIHAWSYETEVQIVINKLHLHTLLNQTVSQCSGGELKRLALAKLILEEPDVLLLDEPTNHLDVAMIERLETYLKRAQRTMIVVTHDRYFLERVCEQIYHLDRGELWIYPWNYSTYLILKAKHEAEIALDQHQLKQVVKREMEWKSKMPRARAKKNVKRVKDADTLHTERKSMRSQNHHRGKSLELSVAKRRIWGKIVTLTNVTKAFAQKKIVDWFSYSFRAGERVGLIGQNGVGKSTFINMLMGDEPVDTGKIQRWETITMSLYQQKQVFQGSTKSVIDLVRDVAEYITIDKGKQISAKDLLQYFLFTPKQQQQKVHTLSGWEKKRLHLLTVLIKNPNFLILDEPTNDLDIETMEVLEDFLQAFQWCLVVVSHDRFFLDRVVDHLLVFEGAWAIYEFPGSYSDRWDKQQHSDKQHNQEEEHEEEKKSIETLNLPKPRKSLTNKEREELTHLEEQMEHLESRRQEINREFAKEWLAHETIASLGKELAEIAERLEEVEGRWLALYS